jgi:hypothetical protein
MIYNKVPFHGQNEYFVMESIRTQPLLFPDNRAVSKNLESLLLFILEKDPQKRPSADEILEHEFFKN